MESVLHRQLSQRGIHLNWLSNPGHSPFSPLSVCIDDPGQLFPGRSPAVRGRLECMWAARWATCVPHFPSSVLTVRCVPRREELCSLPQIHWPPNLFLLQTPGRSTWLWELPVDPGSQHSRAVPGNGYLFNSWRRITLLKGPQPW